MIATAKRFLSRRLPVPTYLWLAVVWRFIGSYAEWHPVAGWVAFAVIALTTSLLISETRADAPQPVITITTDQSKPPECPLGRWHYGPCPPTHEGVKP